MPALLSFGQIVMDVNACLMLIAALLLLGRMRLPSFLQLFALQSFFLVVVAFTSALITDTPQVYVSAAVNLALKVFFVPYLLGRVASSSHASTRLQSYLRPAPTLFLGLTMALTVFWWLNQRLSVFGQDKLLSLIAIIILMAGFLLIIVRRDLYSQTVAFLVMENGIFTFALSLSGGMPLLVELGVFFDVTVGLILMAALSYHVQTEYDTVHTGSLQELVE